MRVWLVLPILLWGTGALAASEEILFNGKDLAGWTAITSGTPGDTRRKVEEVWQVRDGAIMCMGGQGVWASLQTVKDYTNFRLTLEYKWGEIDPAILKAGGNIYNSGVFIRSNPRPPGATTNMPMSYQAQLIHTPLRSTGESGGGSGDMWIMGYDHPTFQGVRTPPPPAAAPGRSQGRGGGGGIGRGPMQPGTAASRQFPRAKFAEKPLGQWNSYEVLFNGDKLTYWLNGELINEGSGAAVVPGKIGFECENTPILFRNIRVTPM